jgi:hypothetical protein
MTLCGIHTRFTDVSGFVLRLGVVFFNIYYKLNNKLHANAFLCYYTGNIQEMKKIIILYSQAYTVGSNNALAW